MAAQAGAAVALAGRREDRLDATRRADRGRGRPRVRAARPTWRRRTRRARSSQRSYEQLGGLDALVNNAGVMLLGAGDRRGHRASGGG